jgi:hypothetical protein
VNRFSVVTENRPKVLKGLHQKVMQPGAEALTSSPADAELPAYGRDLTYSGTYTEHDNPVRLPLPERDGAPRGALMGVRVEEIGRSKRRA